MRAIFRIDKNGSVDNFQLTRCTKLAKVCSCFVNRVFELTSQLTSQLTKKVPKNQYFIYNCQLSTINYKKIVLNKKSMFRNRLLYEYYGNTRVRES